jgi:hypothetical protein
MRKKNSFDYLREYEEYKVTPEELLMRVHKRDEKLKDEGRINKFPLLSDEEFWRIAKELSAKAAPLIDRFTFKAHTCIKALYSVRSGTSDLTTGGVTIGDFDNPMGAERVQEYYINGFVSCLMQMRTAWKGRGVAAKCYDHLVYSHRGGVGNFCFPVSWSLDKYAKDKQDRIYPEDSQPIYAEIHFRFELDTRIYHYEEN